MGGMSLLYAVHWTGDSGDWLIWDMCLSPR